MYCIEPSADIAIDAINLLHELMEPDVAVDSEENALLLIDDFVRFMMIPGMMEGVDSSCVRSRRMVSSCWCRISLG